MRAKFFIVMPDGIGHGKSSKPSDGLHAHFPHYGYTDMVRREFRLLTDGLGVNHARLIMGTSMGGMQTWVWGEQHPDFMDALMPLASLPTQIAGRNRVWRAHGRSTRSATIRTGTAAITKPNRRRSGRPPQMLWLMSSNPVCASMKRRRWRRRTRQSMPTSPTSLKTDDANDIMYALDASHDYDPGPELEKIRAPLLAINSADDLINPPELGILEHEIKRVPHGRAIVIPLSDKTRGTSGRTAWPRYGRVTSSSYCDVSNVAEYGAQDPRLSVQPSCPIARSISVVRISQGPLDAALAVCREAVSVARPVMTAFAPNANCLEDIRSAPVAPVGNDA